MKLDGKIALVTGAARGQGAAEAARLVAEGASVVLTDVLDDAGARRARELGARARYRRLDVCSASDWAAAVALAVSEFGGIDVLVNNAGIYEPTPFAELDETHYRRTLDVNLVGPFLGMQAVLEPMRARGGGSIINVSSANGLTGSRVAAHYSASKFGLRGLSRSAAIELGPLGIRVNTLHPGVTRTEMIRTALEREEEIAATLPLRRVAEPDDLAGAVVWLASDDSSYVTGTEIVVDGGLVA